jgi:uncharacterized protein YbjT (DUF2867 family)
VRAVVRDPTKGAEWAARGCEVALAEMEDAAALTRAFAGATGVFVLPPPVFDPEPGYPEARAVVGAVTHALAAARPGRVVCLSTIGADAVHDNLLSQRTLMEAALRELPIPLTILRPAWFLDNAAWDVSSARANGVIHTFLRADKAFPMVAAADVGNTAASLIQETWAETRVVELEGPSRISPNDLALAFSRALNKAVRAEQVPRDTWAKLFRSQGMKNPEPRIRMLDGFNEGWIEFQDGGQRARKGTTSLDAAIAALVA